MLCRYAIQIVADVNVNLSSLSNVILLGGPSTNYLSQKMAPMFPVSFSGNTFTVGPRTFSSPATGVC